MNHWVSHPSTGSGHAIYDGFLSAQRIKKVILSLSKGDYCANCYLFQHSHYGGFPSIRSIQVSARVTGLIPDQMGNDES